MTIAAELRAGASPEEIFHHYPSLPIDGIEAVRLWAAENRISLDPEAAHS